MKNKGFTLVEILVVLVIIGILVAIILPNALRAIDQGNVKQAAADLRNIDTALDLCYADNGNNWTTCGAAAGGADFLWTPDATGNGKYMEKPNSGVDPWGGAYQVAQDTDTGNYYSVKTTIFPDWPSLTNVSRQ